MLMNLCRDLSAFKVISYTFKPGYPSTDFHLILVLTLGGSFVLLLSLLGFLFLVSFLRRPGWAFSKEHYW